MGPIWGRQDRGGPHVGPMNFAIWAIFKLILMVDGWGISCEIARIMNVIGLYLWSVNIGSSNGLVPSGNRSLHEPMLAALGHNE